MSPVAWVRLASQHAYEVTLARNPNSSAGRGWWEPLTGCQWWFHRWYKSIFCPKSSSLKTSSGQISDSPASQRQLQLGASAQILSSCDACWAESIILLRLSDYFVSYAHVSLVSFWVDNFFR